MAYCCSYVFTPRSPDGSKRAPPAGSAPPRNRLFPLPPLNRHVGLGAADGVLVGGADDALAGGDLLEAVGGPAGHAGAGEQGREQVLGNAHHGVDETGVHIHVRA